MNCLMLSSLKVVTIVHKRGSSATAVATLVIMITSCADLIHAWSTPAGPMAWPGLIVMTRLKMTRWI
jgi:hypothetical protein